MHPDSLPTPPRLALRRGLAETDERPAVILSVGTYNLNNLLGVAPARRQELLAHNIARSGVQLLALQEIHDRSRLEAFLAEYLPGRFPHLAMVPGNDHRGSHVAVLSHYPLRCVLSHREQRVFCRDVLRVDADLGNSLFSLYAIHFKSRRPTLGGGSGSRRLAEALELKRILEEEAGPTPRPFAVAGDFNDEADSPALQALLEAPPPEGLPWGQGLQSALAILPERKRATYPGKNPKRQIDFILYANTRVVAARVWKEARCSDHCLVTAQFELVGSA